MISSAPIYNSKNTLDPLESLSVSGHSASYARCNQTVRFLGNSSDDTTYLPQPSYHDKTRPSHYLKSSHAGHENQSSHDHDAHMKRMCVSSAGESCSIYDHQSMDTALLAQEFIGAISRTFSLPYAGGELDWLKGMDATMYQNPIQALLQSAFENQSDDEDMYCPSTTGPKLYESFLPIDEEDDDSDCDQDSHDEKSPRTYHELDGDSYQSESRSPWHEKQLVRIILPQTVQYDIWKRSARLRVSPKRKLLSFSRSIANIFVNTFSRRRSSG